jgi:hypothetical protein
MHAGSAGVTESTAIKAQAVSAVEPEQLHHAAGGLAAYEPRSKRRPPRAATQVVLG